eukprot:COSAG02_NODE_8190_length_2668_cov_14.312184_2_plen_89_part_00
MDGKAGWQKGLMTVTDAGWPVLRPLPPPPPPAPPPAPPEPKPGPGPRMVVFLIDRTYIPILGPAINAIKDIFQSTVRRRLPVVVGSNH